MYEKATIGQQRDILPSIMMIPRAILFADPHRTQVKISPCGLYVSYLANNCNVLNLWIAPVEQMSAARAVTYISDPIRDYWWMPSSKGIIYTYDRHGDENWQLGFYDVSTQAQRSLAAPGCQARIIKISTVHSVHILIALNERDKHYHDIYKLNVCTGEKTCIFENHEYWDVIADATLACRLGIRLNHEKGEYIDLNTGQCVATISAHDLFGLYFYPKLRPVFSADGKTLYIIQSESQETSALTAIDWETKTRTVLAHRVEADIVDVLYHPKTTKPIAIAFNDDHKKWVALSEDFTKLFDEWFSHTTAEEKDIVSHNAELTQWIISFARSDQPTEYYYADAQAFQFLFLSYDGLAPYHFNPMRTCDIVMRDGKRCKSYLTLPQDATLPISLVLLVHGGPSYRDFWGFNAYHQWLSNRGYAVLSVNYRGSTGFGRMHSEAGNGEWAGKIREDLLEAVEWAIREGITQEDRVAIMGRSFGGYQALLGLTFTPTRYCCGVDIVGPANLETMMRCFPPYWRAMKYIVNTSVGGDPETEAGKAFLKSQSPLTYVDNIQRPLLIGHGQHDPRVQHTESDHMVEAMRRNNVPVTYVVFSNEGHQLAHADNRMAFYGLVETFLAKNLVGGRVEPIVTPLPASVQIREDHFELI